MIEIHPSRDRDYADHDWLKPYHNFSPIDYMDPQHVQFGPLRATNEDHITAGIGFGIHGHHDMETISYMLDGELAHKDSMGDGSVSCWGDV